MAPNVTDWIDSTTGALTLAAAFAAGVFAKRAAHWTKAQAESSAEQVRLAKGALDVARDDAAVAKALAERQREDGERAARRLAEERTDALMPTVLITAIPGWTLVGIHARDFVEIGHYGGEEGPGWHYQSIDARREFSRDDDGVVFAVNATFQLENLSTQVARVAVTQPDRGEVSVPQGQDVVVRPGQTRHLTWTRTIPISELRDELGVHENGSTARVELIVQDLGINAYDRVVVLIDFRHFSRDGSRLVVTSEPASPWSGGIGDPLPDRVYARLGPDRLTAATHVEA